MPELPNVVPGEPVESDWGNDMRDRAIMKYADQVALDASQPLPILGELAWLDSPGNLVQWDGAAWNPIRNSTDNDAQYVDVAGDTMTGPLAGPIALVGAKFNNPIVLTTSYAPVLTVDIGPGTWLITYVAEAFTADTSPVDVAHQVRNVLGSVIISSQVRAKFDGPWNSSVVVVETDVGPGTVTIEAESVGVAGGQIRNGRVYAQQVPAGSVF